ncbi:MAG: DUF547 domain-containing protein [Bacteroidota bacterium]
MRSRLTLVVVLALAGALTGCRDDVSVRPIEAAGPVERPASVDHAPFTAVLQQHVDAAGHVDYAALAADPAGLDAYLGRLAASDPSGLPEDDRLAFYLNAYNAFTLRLVADNYPIESVLDVVGGPFIPSVNSPFSVSFAVIGGEEVSLDDIEHGIIREEYDEPRIHFALVCAAISCPPLRREAYVGDRLDAQLDDQARTFLANADKNRVDVEAGTASFSKIFDWFKDDFGGSDDDLQRFMARYYDGEARRQLEAAALDVSYGPYDWSLNAQTAPPES